MFDPMRETWWTLAMAVAWIAWRSPKRVRENWNAYRAECWDWYFREWREGPGGHTFGGYFLEQRKASTLVRLGLSEAFEDHQGQAAAPGMTVKDAIDALWVGLGEGLFQATGISTKTADRVPIPEYEWPDLQHIEERDRDVLRFWREGHLPSGGYDKVLLPGGALVQLWVPQRPKTSRPHLPPTAGRRPPA